MKEIEIKKNYSYEFAEYNGKIEMNNATKYFQKQMENEEFRNSYFAEKIKLDLEFLIDELADNINSEKPKTQLLSYVKKIKSTLAHA